MPFINPVEIGAAITAMQDQFVTDKQDTILSISLTCRIKSMDSVIKSLAESGYILHKAKNKDDEYVKLTFKKKV